MKNLSIKHLVLGLSLIFIVVVVTLYLQEAKPSKEALITKATPVSYVGALPINAEDISTQATPSLTEMAASVTAEAVKAFSDSADYSLPLFSHWNVGKTEIMNPTYMLSRLENGEHVLVSWKLDLSNLDTTVYEESIKKAAELELPLIFIVPAPESSLIEEGYSLSEDENPNVVDADGNILNKLSPFGPDKNWYDIGKKWSSTSLMAQIQEWYPNPPLVVFMNENMASKLSWSEVETSSRYTSYYPSGKDDEYKRALVGAKWIEKYRQMHAGFKLGFVKEDWKNNVKFVSYNDFSDDLGQLSTWAMNSTLTKQYLDICPFTVNGTTVNFDLTQSINYTNIDAPQIPINNLPFMLKEAKRNNPSFVQQLSIAHNSNLTDLALYRGLTQFGLWFLRPSIIRQNSPVGTLEETEPLFDELSNSVELIHNSDILSDFWKNGKLVSNGESDLNSNIPEQYQDDPRWFLLDVDANPSRPWSDSSNIKVWSFALVKGVAPNREWLIYAQSPENEMSNVTAVIPDYGDVLIDSDKNGKFFILLENDNQLNPMTFQTISEESTTLPKIISPYLETVNLPTCDANNPEVQFIESNEDWNHINDTDKSMFCVSPGDYSSAGEITLTVSGTEDKRRYIVLNNGNNIHPGKLLKENVANYKLVFKNASYWTIDRMSTQDATDPSRDYYTLSFIDASKYNIINRSYFNNNFGTIKITHLSDNNTIQQSRISNMTLSALKKDKVAITLSAQITSDYVEIKNTKIIANEIVNCGDSFQAVRHNNTVGVFYDANYEGTIIDSNHMSITSDLYTDGSGNFTTTGTYAYAENAIDLKAGSDNVNNPIIITNNHMWGFRRSDQTDSYLNDWGGAVVIHFGVKNLVFKNNYIFDSARGIAVAEPDRFQYSLSDSEISNNHLFNIGVITEGLSYEFFSYFYDTKNIKFINNDFIGISKNAKWFNGTSTTNDTTISCNVIVNTLENTNILNESNTIQYNSYYNTAAMKQDSEYILDFDISNAQLVDYMFTTDNYTSNPKTFNLLNGFVNASRPNECIDNL